MARLGWRNWFKRGLGPLVWLAGLALIIYYAPADYRALRLADGEQVFTFRGKSHELVVLGGGTVLQDQPDDLPAELALTRRARPLTDAASIFLLDMDKGARRELNLDRPKGPTRLPDAIGNVTSCPDGNWLCIEYAFRRGMAIVDAQSGKSLLTVKELAPEILGSRRWSTNIEGSILAYCNSTGRVICSAVASGRELYTFHPVDYDPAAFDSALRRTLPPLRRIHGHGNNWADGVFLSPDGQRLAIKTPHADRPAIIDMVLGQLKMTLGTDRAQARSGLTPVLGSQEISESFSPRGDAFIDLDGQVWDLASERIVCTAAGPCVFADAGKKVAWLKPTNGGTEVEWFDIEAHRQLSDPPLWIPQNVARIEAFDVEGTLIHVHGTHDPRERTWIEKVEDWIGLKPGPRKPPHYWLLIDGRSRKILHRGWGDLLAVSADGRYAVAGDEDGSRVKVYELPVRRSILFMAIGGAAWTILVAIVWLWWRRRASIQSE